MATAGLAMRRNRRRSRTGTEREKERERKRKKERKSEGKADSAGHLSARCLNASHKNLLSILFF